MIFSRKLFSSLFENPWGDDKEPIRPKFGGKKTSNNGKGNNPNQKIDEIFSNLKKYNNKNSGGGDNGSSPKSPNFNIVPFVIIGTILLWLLSGFYTIQPDEQGVVLRFGKYDRISSPGLNYRLPSPFEHLIKVQVTKINSIEVGYRSYRNQKSEHRNESIMLTGDENIIDVKFEVQWQIKNAFNYLFKIRDDEDAITVKNSAESAMREIIGKSKIAYILSDGRYEIEQEAKKLLQDILDSYESGIDVVRLQLLEADPPVQVIDAFRDVQTAKADKERAINQAKTYSNDIIPRARGDASQIIEDAKAYENQVVEDAKGKASRFLAVYAEYKKAKDVTRKRIYLDTMQEILQSADITIIDKDTSNTGVVPYLAIQK